MLDTFTAQAWNHTFSLTNQQSAMQNLEQGQIIYFPQLAFVLNNEEQRFLSPDYADPKAKNISYHAQMKKLWGVRNPDDSQYQQMKNMLDRYSQYAFGLIKNLFPSYVPHLTVARTSYRPVQITGRITSPRKDDKRLHVDAFPSAPNQGKRILRVFTNVNPHGEDRVWRIGEPFEEVAKQFLPQINKPIPGAAAVLRALKITKSYRTAYDHYMLRMHDTMKADNFYQNNAGQQEIRFPPGSSWIVQTDHVSHAAMTGQYLLEQTFSLPVHAMQNEDLAPLRILERLLKQKLI